jgi:hypothetical protein
MSEGDLRDLVADFRAAKWAMVMTAQQEEGETTT